MNIVQYAKLISESLPLEISRIIVGFFTRLNVLYRRRDVQTGERIFYDEIPNIILSDDGLIFVHNIKFNVAYTRYCNMLVDSKSLINGHFSIVYTLDCTKFSPNNDYTLILDSDGFYIIHRHHQPIVLAHYSDVVYYQDLLISPSGEYILIHSKEKKDSRDVWELYNFDIRRVEPIHRMKISIGKLDSSAIFHPNGKDIICCTFTNLIVRDIETDRKIFDEDLGFYGGHMKLSSDNKMLLIHDRYSMNKFHKVALISFETMSILHIELPGFICSKFVCMIPYTKMIVAVIEDGKSLYTTGYDMKPVTFHVTSRVTIIICDYIRSRFVTAHEDGSVTVWDVTICDGNMKIESKIIYNGCSRVRYLYYSNCGYLMISYKDVTIVFDNYDMETLRINECINAGMSLNGKYIVGVTGEIGQHELVTLSIWNYKEDINAKVVSDIKKLLLS